MAKGLSKQIIVSEAIAYICESETPEIPIREIARRLGVKAPSLYNHIKNTDELKYAVLQRAMDLLVENQRKAISGKKNDESVRAFAKAYYSFAIENKGLYKLIMSIPSDDDDIAKEIALPLLELVVSILSEYELSENETAHWQRVFRAILHGFVSQEYLGYFYFYKDVDINESLNIAIDCFLKGLHTEVYDIATKSAQMFERISDKENADYCLAFADSIRKNIRKHLFNPDTCAFAGDCQTSQAMGIYYKIIDESEKEKAFSVLLDKIIESDYHIDTGVLGGRVIFHILAENGHIDSAIKMLTNPTAPSYAQWVNDGDTTLCEGFYEYDGLSSHNHHFWGNISAFFMEQICGIKPMADKIIIAPHFPSDMSFARAEFDSVFGKIKVEWERLDGEISFNIDCDDSVKDKLVLERFK